MVEKINITLFKRFVLVSKVLPMVLAFCHFIHIILSYFYIDTTFINYFASISILTVAYLYLVNYVLKLCSYEEKILENFISLLSDKVFILNSKIKSISFKSLRQKVINYILNEVKEQKSSSIILKNSKEYLRNIKYKNARKKENAFR